VIALCGLDADEDVVQDGGGRTQGGRRRGGLARHGGVLVQAPDALHLPGGTRLEKKWCDEVQRFYQFGSEISFTRSE
jgi:hypothetical protein